MADNVEVDVHDIKSILTSSERDYLVRNNGDQVAISVLKGKKIGLYFSASWCPPCQRFTPNLVEVYNELLPKGDIEIIFISADEDVDAFTGYFSKMPWLALPFSDSATRESLDQLFKVNGIPHLVFLDENGKLLTDEGVEIISEYGSEAYPFTPERFKEIKDQEEEARKNQTLESVLVSGDLDYVIGKNESKVRVSDLVGKHVLLYFSAHWCPPCRAFTPKLIETYHDIKSKHDDFEVIFISSDRDENSFNEYYETMPWLALPYGDKREQSLSRHFKVDGIPMLAALGPTGKTVTTEARGLILSHGVKAYPFTEERMAEIEMEFADMAKGWPDKVKHGLHEEHELVLTRSQGYGCDGCDVEGEIWAYSCEECGFDLHPECAFKENNGKEVVENTENHEGWVCDGDVCYKV